MAGFEIPNEVDAGDAAQTQIDAHDFYILREGVRGNGVWKIGDECEVTAQGTPDNTVAVAEGVVVLDGQTFQVDADAISPTFAVNSGVGDRFDLVVYDTGAGAIEIVEGAEHATNPVFPTPDADHIVLAAVLIQDTETSDVDVATADIVDKRVWVTPLAGLPMVSSSTNDVITNGDYGSNSGMSTTVGNSVDLTLLQAIYLPFEFTFDNFWFYMAGLPDSGADADSPVARMALYRAGDDGEPDVLVIAGDNTVDISDATGSTGNKYIPVNSAGTVTLPPGLYYIALVLQNIENSTANPTVWAISSANEAVGGYNAQWLAGSTGTSGGWNGGYIVSDVTGAFPSTVSGQTIVAQNQAAPWVGLRQS